jgi:uncharacterized protein
MTRSVRLITVALALAASCAGVDVKSLKPEGYVSDFARVIDGATRAQLEQYALRVDRMTGVQMAFVTIDTLDGEPAEDFANNLYRHWGIGQKGKDEGLLLLLAVKDHRSRLEIGRGLEPVITDGTSGSILRQMRPSLTQNDFGEAMTTAARMLGDRVAQAKGVNLNEYTPQPRRRAPPQGFSVPWPLLIGGIFLLMWLAGRGASARRANYNRYSRYGPYGRRGGSAGDILTGMVIGSMMGRGGGWSGGSSGGGFGGFDSGDSFGGFGGGDSGGGGATSDW